MNAKMYMRLLVGGLVLAVTMAVGSAAAAGQGDEPEDDAAVAQLVDLDSLAPGELDALKQAELDRTEASPDDEDGSASPLSHHGCASGEQKSCLWRNANFMGKKRFVRDQNTGGPGEWWIIDGYTFRSAKNRFANRKLRLKSFSTGIARCVNPGGNRRSLVTVMSGFKAGKLGSRCRR